MDDGKPVEENWINRYESENFAGLVNYSDRYQPGALRYEVGEHSNFILIPMMLAAVRQINAWGADSIQTYCQKLISESLKKLTNAGFQIEEDAYRASHLFGVRLSSNHNMEDFKTALAENNILVSVRGDSIRVSPNVYNSENEMRKFSDVLLNIR